MPRAQIKDEKSYRKLRNKGESKGKAARIANATAGSSTSKVGRKVWAITLFPRGSDQVIPQVLALLLFYFPLVFAVGTTRPGLLLGR